MADNKTDAEVLAEVERRLAEIELLRRQATQQGLAFAARSREQLETKIRAEALGSPYIYAQGWMSRAAPGGSGYVYVAIANPDPVPWYTMFVSVFFGLANFSDKGEALAGRDESWPYLASAPFDLTAAATSTQSMTFITPDTAVPTTYLGNAFLWSSPTFGQGTYLDRSLFYLAVT